MFGKIYSKYPDILRQSFSQMSGEYEKKVKNKKQSHLLYKFQQLYVAIFGIPEIGFQIRSIYFKKIVAKYLFFTNIKSILDAGCGIGAYTFWLAEKYSGAKIIGGEIDKQKIKYGKLIQDNLKIKNISFEYMNILKTIKGRKFDLIVTIDVLEHIDNYEKVIKNFYSSLSRNGYLIIHVPQNNQIRIFKSLRSWHHSDHIHEGINRIDLEKKLKKIGFRIICARETYGFFGKFAWELNHMLLSKSLILAGITFPFLYILVRIDALWKNKNGLGIILLALKN